MGLAEKINLLYGKRIYKTRVEMDKGHQKHSTGGHHMTDDRRNLFVAYKQEDEVLKR